MFPNLKKVGSISVSACPSVPIKDTCWVVLSYLFSAKFENIIARSFKLGQLIEDDKQVTF